MPSGSGQQSGAVSWSEHAPLTELVTPLEPPGPTIVPPEVAELPFVVTFADDATTVVAEGAPVFAAPPMPPPFPPSPVPVVAIDVVAVLEAVREAPLARVTETPAAPVPPELAD